MCIRDRDWSGKLSDDDKRNMQERPDIQSALFCQSNKLIAARKVLYAYGFTKNSKFSENKHKKNAEMIKCAQILLNEKALTTQEKVDAMCSLEKKPDDGYVMFWPNSEGVMVPFDASEFLESVMHNFV